MQIKKKLTIVKISGVPHSLSPANTHGDMEEKHLDEHPFVKLLHDADLTPFLDNSTATFRVVTFFSIQNDQS